jgi:hypothetical protein
VRFVAPRIGEHEARERLRPRGWLGGWLGGFGGSPTGGLDGKRLPHLELVWLPFLHAEDGGGRACVVCASTGLPSRFDRSGLSDAEVGEVEALSFHALALERGRLCSIARAHLARVGALAGAEPSADLLFEDRALPFWVLHYERRPGRLDFVALDALSGAGVGGAMRQALLRSMVGDASGPSTIASR